MVDGGLTSGFDRAYDYIVMMLLLEIVTSGIGLVGGFSQVLQVPPLLTGG